MRTNKPSKYYSPAPVLIPNSTTIPLQAVVLCWKDIQTIIIHVGSDIYPVKQNDIDDVKTSLSILDFDSYFQHVQVEMHDANGIQLRSPDSQPPVYNLDLATINQEIGNIHLTHPSSFVWILVGDNNHLASYQDKQDVCDCIWLTYRQVVVSYHLIEFHCYQ
jgi:hypothetical protein